ncbi:MAG: restriction endonuclease subunit S [Bacteroidales bacterium]|nr:restriction endonuclease subunit S [Bacteroidales bacterium]
MKAGWKYKKLREVANVTAGQGAPQGDDKYCDNGTPFIKAGNLEDLVNGLSEESVLKVSEEVAKSHKLKLYPIGSVLFAKSGMSCMKGWVHTIKRDCYVVSHIAIITPFNIDSTFLNYYFRHIKTYSLVKDAAYPTISLKDIENLLIPVPSLTEQRSIVSRLDAAFAKIDALKANAEKQLCEARQLFQSELAECMRPKEGWEEKRLGEVCTIARGGSPRPIKNYITNEPNGLNWIKIGDTDMGGKYIYSTKEKIKPEGLKKSRWVEEDEFLLSNSMSFGRPYILKTSGCIHDGWLVLRDYQYYLNIDFFYYVLSSEYIQKQFRTKAQGSTVSNLNTDRVASVSISVPPLSEQQSIVSRLDALSANIKKLGEVQRKTLAECDALKQAMLREVFE